MINDLFLIVGMCVITTAAIPTVVVRVGDTTAFVRTDPPRDMSIYTVVFTPDNNSIACLTEPPVS